MKTALMTELRKIRMEERSTPITDDDEVLVKIEYVGICGSDLHYFETGRIGNFIVEPPFVLGHEAAGTIVKTGKNVTSLKIGDRVALEPGKTCGKCEQCKSGKYNLCQKVKFLQLLLLMEYFRNMCRIRKIYVLSFQTMFPHWKEH